MQQRTETNTFPLYGYPIFFCFAITLHNIEEELWLPQWSQLGHPFQQPVTTTAFHIAVLIVTALAYVVSFLFCVWPNCRVIKQAFVGFLGAMLLNALLPHLLLTTLTKSYAPGVITALLLNVPINAITLYFLHKQQLTTLRQTIFSTIIVGSLLLILIALLFNNGNHMIRF